MGMAESLLEKLVRNFPENGPKLLLENSDNVRDLLVLLHEPQVDAIDFTAMSVERSHFVQPHYAHVAVEPLLQGPLHLGGQPCRSMLNLLLVELQIRPHGLFMLRRADCTLEAHNTHIRAL